MQHRGPGHAAPERGADLEDLSVFPVEELRLATELDLDYWAEPSARCEPDRRVEGMTG